MAFVSGSRYLSSASLATLVVVLSSCKGADATGSGNDGTTEVQLPPPPLPPPSNESVDGTAGSPPEPSCLEHPLAGESRARWQCAGSLEATLTLSVAVAGIDVHQEPVPIQRPFGHGHDGDAYADPLVMACCAELTDPFCASAVSQSCYLDLIHTSCQSLPERIVEKANEQGLPGPKQALEALAEHMRNDQAGCRASFGAGEIESAAPTCSPDQGSSYGPLLVGRQWTLPGTFSGGTTDITNVIITVKDASVTGAHPADSVGLEGCWSLEDNDDTPHFLEIFPVGPLVESVEA